MSDWNRTWTEADEYNVPSVRAMFGAAIDERLKAVGHVGGVAGPPRVLPAMPAGSNSRYDPTRSLVEVDSDPVYSRSTTLQYCTGYPSSTGTAGAPSWYSMQQIVAWLARFFVDPATAAAGYSGIHYRAQVADFSTYYDRGFSTTGETNFDQFSTLDHRIDQLPSAGAMRRKREREITRISDGGANAERARYIYSTSPWKTDGTYLRHTSPSPDAAASLVGEIGNSRKLFDRVSGVWQLSADQTSDPDIKSLLGFGLTGDLFGSWVLNDLRDALNRMTLTQVGTTISNSVIGFVTSTSAFTSLRGRLKLGQAFGQDYAATEAQFDADTSSGDVLGARCRAVDCGSNFSGYTKLESVENYYYVRLPTHCARAVTFYLAMLPGETDSFLIAQSGGQAGRIFAPFGSGYTIRTGNYAEANLISSSGVTSSEYVLSSLVGNADTKPTYGTAPSSKGWSVGRTIAIVDWGVSGGFAYTAAT